MLLALMVIATIGVGMVFPNAIRLITSLFSAVAASG